jgi:formylglycine-generating enzyme required for sulfatase activity
MRTVFILAAALASLVAFPASAHADPIMCIKWRTLWRDNTAGAEAAQLRSFLDSVPRKCVKLRQDIQRHIEHRFLNTTTTTTMKPTKSPADTTPVTPPPTIATGGFRDCPDCPEMVAIPAGSFIMGSPPDEAGHQDNEAQHPVNVAAFAVGVFEVTVDEWFACQNAGGCGPYTQRSYGQGLGNRPIVEVSWEDAQWYTQWLSQRTGYRYRLLTEEEWEYAARGPMERGVATRFSWGDQDPVCDEHAPNGANFHGCPDDAARPVGSFLPNGWGLYDIHGNVWEWVHTCSDASCDGRFLRGGSWLAGSADLRSANRSYSEGPRVTGNLIGFRVARSL